MAYPIETGKLKKYLGFTLIELLVVMVIIGTLLSIATPRYFSSLEQSKEVALKQDLVVIREAINNFHNDLNRYPINLIELVDRMYLRGIPTDPITGRKDTWGSIQSNDPEDPGLNDIRSGAEGRTRDGTPYKQL